MDEIKFQTIRIYRDQRTRILGIPQCSGDEPPKADEINAEGENICGSASFGSEATLMGLEPSDVEVSWSLVAGFACGLLLWMVSGVVNSSELELPPSTMESSCRRAKRPVTASSLIALARRLHRPGLSISVGHVVCGVVRSGSGSVSCCMWALLSRGVGPLGVGIEKSWRKKERRAYEEQEVGREYIVQRKAAFKKGRNVD